MEVEPGYKVGYALLYLHGRCNTLIICISLSSWNYVSRCVLSNDLICASSCNRLCPRPSASTGVYIISFEVPAELSATTLIGSDSRSVPALVTKSDQFLAVAADCQSQGCVGTLWRVMRTIPLPGRDLGLPLRITDLSRVIATLVAYTFAERYRLEHRACVTRPTLSLSHYFNRPISVVARVSRPSLSLSAINTQQ